MTTPLPPQRIFLAVPVEPTAAIERMLAELAELDPHLRLTPPNQLHVTLAFLGDQPADRIPAILQAAKDAARTAPATRVQLGGLGAFPDPARPRVVWTRFLPAAPIRTLGIDLIKRLEGVPYARDRRAWQPHVTLARCGKRRASRRLAQRLQQSKALLPDLGSVVLSELVTYRSRLDERGARHEPLDRVPLAGPV